MENRNRDVHITDFQDYRDYLTVVSSQYKSRRNRPFSLNLWARRLGFKSPRSIAMVIKGQRLPSPEMIDCLSRDLELSELERRYFELLVRLERAKRRGKDLTALYRDIKSLSPSKKVSIEANTFSYLSAWYFFAIKQLVGSPDFRESVIWIRKKLRNKVTHAEVRESIELMLKLGILERDLVTKKLIVRQSAITTTDDVPSAALKQHHKQMIARAVEAIDEQKVEKREIRSLTFRMNPKKIGTAKQRIRSFMEAFEREFYDDMSGNVYQLNMQLFEHTNEEG